MNRSTAAARGGREPAPVITHRGRRRGPLGSAGRRRLAALLATALTALSAALVALPGQAGAAPSLPLGAAASYGVLASLQVTNTDSTRITGDLGVSPGNTVSGFPPGGVTGTIHAGDAAAANAMAAAVAVRDQIVAMPTTATIGASLGGTTRGPGVYNSTSGAFAITSGTLTLDAQADPDAIFVFRASSLTAGNVSNIELAGGAQEDNIFWQIGNTVTLGTYPTFRGNVLAGGDISVGSGSAVFGRMFSLGGTVALTGTTSIPATRVTVPNNPPTTTTVTSTPNPSTTGQSVTFTADVQAVSGSVVPAGKVAFKDNGVVIGIDSQYNGHPAQFTTSSLSPGQHRITAVYLSGPTFDNEAVIYFKPSTSPELVQSVSSTGLWSDSATPAVASHNDSSAVVLGVKFTAAQDGLITGIRFYKGASNVGTHTGSLWTAGGDKLASVTFTNETASGWQRMNFPSPVAISANTTYVASYHTTSGYYSVNRDYFTSPYVNAPLTAPASAASGGNGVYAYSASDTFPVNSHRASNYWVDVMFTPAQTLWDGNRTPAVASHNDPSPVVLGVKFQSSQAGDVIGIRFHKGGQNTGTHVGSLWTSGGTKLATVTFTGETPSGWQEAYFPTPVGISANTTYVASYHTTSGRYSLDRDYFDAQHVNGSLTAPASSASGGNGVYAYSASDTFPSSSFRASNYWVAPVVQYDG
ncbi:DUF4082 domain-containing protein [Microbispora sp. H11081]|uniref:DUF4082 domain-containing protein n=1 Tax=Microbispora sp. H11081 TaxID=2729107 RepID=UPI0014754088|nr:DUF4082 domain-containing protein [Microbispora sp. H11081]